ncbi:MAG: DoxX family protein [Pseudomonadota bacterium]
MTDLLKNDAAGKLVLRLTVGGLMLFHGISKLLNPDSVGFIGSKLADAGLPEILSYAVYIGEIVAPLMIISGFLSRAGAALVVANMLFAILLVHTGDIFALNEHGGWRLELQGFYLFGSLAIIFLGSGRYAARPG